MSLDLDNLGPAPDIETFDASKMDRGDALLSDEPEVKDEPVVEPEVKDEPVVDEPEVKDEQVDDEPEAKDEPEEGDKPARDKKGQFEAKIPKSRFDEAVGKEREAREAAERRAAELERKLNEQAQAQVQTEQIEKLEEEISGMEKKHAELLLDGNIEGAAKVMGEIRMAERQIARAESDAVATQRTAAALETDRVTVAIARLEADYPIMNPKSDQFDQDIVDLVLTKQRTLMRDEGLSPSQALTEAAQKVAERFIKAPEPEDEKEGLAKAAAKRADERKQEQLKKNLETQKKQPPSMKESGIDSDKAGQTGLPDVSMMTQDEFAALPESTKAKLRGDFI